MIKKVRGEMPDFDGYDKFKQVVPILIASEVKNHFLKGFRTGGGQTDRSRGGWTQRKNQAREKRRGRAILVDTGSLRGDIKIRQRSFNRIVVGTRNIEYANYINEGTDKMVQREFIGDSRTLNIKILKIINTQFKTILK